ncbi:cation:proton antiporter, partial [Kocuria rosea]|uniref:cation:proton antiporter n=2 Tax=Kocuria TaxID=57493 RepID=UPI003D33EBDE
MHAGTKPQVFGLLLMLTAVALENREPVMIPLIILGWIFQLLTVPVSAHMVGRSTYRSKHFNQNTLTQDDLQEVLEQVSENDTADLPAPSPTLPKSDGRRAATEHTDGTTGSH